jgi:uncharacterized ferritin-like protein (DUF455 family)
MEASLLAKQILSSENLNDKLFTPDIITDLEPGSPFFWDTPARSPEMLFSRRSKNEKLPKNLFEKDEHRAVCLHRFAGHELLAVEIMAFALLAFPNAPKTFRKGLITTLLEEQEHVRLYQKELSRFGCKLGDMPLYKHFWKLTPFMTDISKYVSITSLTLEMANLDFAPHYGALFEKAGDIDSSNLMKRIYTDEIKHVAFGYGWLKKYQDKELTPLKEWLSHLPELVEPKRAKGPIFNPEGRKKAGLDDEYILFLKDLC